MGYEASVLADSITTFRGKAKRLTTVQVTLPRMVLAEFNTHRVFSRNSASSRAIPVHKQIERVKNDPFIPSAFGANQKGMQAGADLDADANMKALEAWERIRQCVLGESAVLADVGVHKQWANRPLELFGWHTIICTATEWDNFYALRMHAAASPEIRTAATMMCAAMDASSPQLLHEGMWHWPLVTKEEIEGLAPLAYEPTLEKWDAARLVLTKLSVARCARVSYLTHDGKKDVHADVELYNRLTTSGHMSPLEHAAKVASGEEILRHAYWKCVNPEVFGKDTAENPVHFEPEVIGNLAVPWLQHRKLIPGEALFAG